MHARLDVLAALADIAEDFRVDVTVYDWGSDRYKRRGTMMPPEEGLDALRSAAAIYFGAVGDPDVPDNVTSWDFRLAIYQGFDPYVRPARVPPGVGSPLRHRVRIASTG